MSKRMPSTLTLIAAATLSVMTPVTCLADDFKSIAEEAFIYGYPMVMAYGIMSEYTLDKHSSQYKGPFNKIISEDRVYTPADTAVVTPNSDTPYSFIMLDLRAEPIVLCVPKIDEKRYYSVQLTDQYTFNYAYIGSRATGNDAGCYGIAGPNWQGETPSGIKQMFHSETEFSAGIYRTQLYNDKDIANVKKVQAGYTAQPLSAFLHQAAPAPAPKINWLKVNKKQIEANPFNYLNFILQFAPAIGNADVEKSLRDRFASIGIVAGQPFEINKLTPVQKADLRAAFQSAMAKITEEAKHFGQDENGWRLATDGFGSRAAYDGNWLRRAAVAMAGIYANDPAEALYPITRIDSQGNYTITFPAGQLPPVNAFWSVTMYDGKTQLLIKNPINRYLINSPMLPTLKTSTDGSLTLYIQNIAPAKDKLSNWLPAPNGPIYLVMRLYWPKETALLGTWKPPVVEKTKH